ncbi:Dabb family protein [Marinomonas posidonica]|uniref:Stress responsive alpha-beta barrel domain-containing protein n=1 Tax=Marinomonas posidonica (strain CECT 7376 / NCIMB 14433 / IVIA-Po-181) TaxID=491952 RepID=F6CUC1_MARPP|nr:Dabb family protein [Marinomonas posidonica]AEF55240.1 Stress responsive alpha-beta barrel domain-containing protein [Marinomonas posidonica IVIA-Po-181]
MLQHHVFIKYQEGTSAEHIDTFQQKMLALKDCIAEIQQLEIGVDELHQARSWDLILNMQFQSIEDLQVYQKHPEHQAVMAFNGPKVAEVGAIDFHK